MTWNEVKKGSTVYAMSHDNVGNISNISKIYVSYLTKGELGSFFRFTNNNEFSILSSQMIDKKRHVGHNDITYYCDLEELKQDLQIAKTEQLNKFDLLLHKVNIWEK